MLVVAFDGLLFDTLALRASAIIDAFAAEGAPASEALVFDVIASRTIAEAVRACSKYTSLDETALDLVVLRAERAVGDVTSRGALLNVALRDRLKRAAAVTRVVVRADSKRRDVESLLAMSELDSIVSFVQCSDDGERGGMRTIGSMVEKSYAAIAKRMAGNMNLLGERSAIGIALEVSDTGRAAARMLGFETPDTPNSAPFPGSP